jgi:N-acyl-D-amino-acid deacylase
MVRFGWIVSCFALLLVGHAALGSEPEFTAEQVRAAVKLAILPLEAGSSGSADQRKCFTCHSQALPILALAAAKFRGFTIDEKNFERQVKHTYDFLAEAKEKYVQGKGQGGQVLTAGYALWALDAAGKPKDEVTAAVAGYIAGYQGNESHWHHRGKRPPSSGSDFSATYVALRGMKVFGDSTASTRVQTALRWLNDEQPKETEDHVFRLRSLLLSDDSSEKALAELLKLQRPDGGWSQKSDMESDAYATGSVLVTLLEAGVSTDDPAVHRGLAWLLNAQQADGTWHVKTRAIGFQEYYESGFPHGQDQFISITASGWATWALVLSLPPS